MAQLARQHCCPKQQKSSHAPIPHGSYFRYAAMDATSGFVHFAGWSAIGWNIGFSPGAPHGTQPGARCCKLAERSWLRGRHSSPCAGAGAGHPLRASAGISPFGRGSPYPGNSRLHVEAIDPLLRNFFRALEPGTQGCVLPATAHWYASAQLFPSGGKPHGCSAGAHLVL